MLRFSFQAVPVLLWLAAAGFAQESAGTFSGLVADSTGAGVPGAEVIAVQTDTGALRKTTSGSEGTYAFPDVPIGPYEISVTHSGFKKTVKKGLQLHVSEHLGIDLALEIGELTQVVAVTANAEMVETESSHKGGLISGEQVRDLQLNGRGYLTLMELVPGVVSNNSDRSDPLDQTLDLSVNGARSSAGTFGIDGVSNPSVIGSNELNSFTSVETIAEFTVLTSNFSAEYGKAGTSQVNVVTKGGTRQFHGSLYEFVRNDAFDAHDYFSHSVLPLQLNNFGGTLGGPVILPHYNRDRLKTFFFVTQEWNLINTRGEAINTTVPDAAQRRGDFSAAAPNAVIDPDTKVSFPGGIIPASRINPNAVKLLNLYPLPNFKGPGAINYTSAAPSWMNYHQNLFRIDQNFSPQLKVYGRYIFDHTWLDNPYGGQTSTAASNRFPGIGETNLNRSQKNLAVNMSNIFRPTLLNQFSFNYVRSHLVQLPAAKVANRAQLGLTIPELFPENDGDLIPTITLGSNYPTMTVPRPNYMNLYNAEVSDNLTKIYRRHVIKIGGLYLFGGDREPSSAATNGTFGFATNFTKDPVANMLLGLVNTYTEADKVAYSNARFPMAEAYFQDDFKVTGRLTLNLGIRYSAYFSPYDADNNISNFIPARYDPKRAVTINPSTGALVANTGDSLNGFVLGAKTSPYGRRITNSNTNLIAPRIGFAWAPFRGKKTAIRGGYGIYYTRPIPGAYMNTSLSDPPFSRTVTIQQPTLDNPSGGAQAAQTAPNVVSMAVPMRAGRVQQWSLGVQHEVFRNAILDASYVGSHGTQLVRPVNINDPEPGAAALAKVNVNAVRPYLGYGSITERQPTGSSIYHSFQASFNRRMTRKFSTGFAYTFGKTIDIGSSDRGSGDIPPNNHNIRAERGPADFNRSHVFTANFIWNLPSPVHHGAFLKQAINGWEFSGIARMWSGRPFDVVMSADVAGIGTTQNQRPNVVADTKGPRTVEHWFNQNAFARPANYTFGNMGRNSMWGPGVNKWDLSLFKNFTAGTAERLRFQFRAEFFNAFNHPSYTTVGASLNTTSTAVNPLLNNFGVVTGTRDARVLQFAVKMSF